MNSSVYDEEQAVRVARLADVTAVYDVTNHTPQGVVAHKGEKSFDEAFRRMRVQDGISSMTVDFRWRVGVRSGSGNVVYNGDARFPHGTTKFAQSTIRNLIVRSIAQDLASA